LIEGTLSLTFSAQDIRKIILTQSYRAHVGHIGSALSIADIITAVYAHSIHVSDPEDPDRDRFVLSKGHAALALYAALHLRGWLSADELNSYCCDGSLVGVHPECELCGIDFSTGSLGQGIAMAVGAALAARLQGSQRLTFCVVSDAECNEGILWEAVMFAAHHHLANLIAIVDVNGQQALGYTRDVMDLSPLSERWRAFGWDAQDVDGHDVAGMAALISSLDTQVGRPHVLLAHTTFGKGVSFMENQIKWHYLPLSDEQFQLAYQEVS
jgi:transketolase